MNKTNTSLLLHCTLVLWLMALVGVVIPVQAMPVDPVKAQNVAENFARQHMAGETVKAVNITAETPYTEFYVFRLEIGNDGLHEGFVLVAADNCVTPILGYSMDNIFAFREMPSNVRGWLESYELQIRHYKEMERNLQAQGADMSWLYSSASLWARLSGENLAGGTGVRFGDGPQYTPVLPLLTTTWNQAPYYNSLCPYDSEEERYTYAGCVATATAQVMKYWNHPVTGYGSHSYEHDAYGVQSADFGSTTYLWNMMPNSLSENSTAEEVNAVATLMYHIGVAINMDYGTYGSGAATGSYGNVTAPSAENALKTYFKYSSALHGIFLEDYTSEEWNQLLRNELDNNRPVLYSGHDTTGGHAFVCDGYDSDGQFHINWGWGSSCDGYYVIGQLNPSSGGAGGNSSSSYNLSNLAIIGIQPNTAFSPSSTTTVTVSSNNPAAGSTTGGGTFNFGETVTLRASANSGCRFVQWNDGYKHNPRQFLASGGTYNFTAQFEPLSGDTLGYCTNHILTSFGTGNQTSQTYWGIKLPSSVLTEGHDLVQVQLYVVYAGVYELKVYVGNPNNSNSTTYEQSFFFNDEDAGAWHTMSLATPVTITGAEDVWIRFGTYGLEYPAAMSTSSGNSDGLLWGTDFYPIIDDWDYTFMIRGIFSPAPLPGITISGPTECYDYTQQTFTATAEVEGTINWVLPDITPATAVGNSVTVQWTNPGYRTLTAYISTPDIMITGVKRVGVKHYNAPDNDTVSYCHNLPHYGNWGNQSETWFGISLPPDILSGRTTIEAVQLYPLYEGYYTVYIFSGNDQQPNEELYAEDVYLSETQQWVTIPLSSSVIIPPQSHIWVVFLTAAASYPGAICNYAVDTRSNWISSNGYYWAHIGDENQTYSWMIRCITSSSETFTITAVPNNSSMGYVEGGNTYLAGATATLKAIPYSNYRFDHWQDGATENPRNVTVTGDATYTAYFVSNVGIDQADGIACSIFPNPTADAALLSLSGISGKVTVEVMDMVGCTVLRQDTEAQGDLSMTLDLSTLSKGSYLVRISNAGQQTVKRLVKL